MNTGDAKRTKVRDHSHITGHYRGAACSNCNLNMLEITKKYYPVVAICHNLRGYDLHHIMRNIKERNTDIVAITSEKFLCTTLKHTEISNLAESHLPSNKIDKDKHGKAMMIRYIESMAFLNSSLRLLGDNLLVDKFQNVKDFATYRIVNREDPNIIYFPEMVIQASGSVTRSTPANILDSTDTSDYRHCTQPPGHAETVRRNQSNIKCAIKLLRCKGIYPYDWMDDASKMDITELPPKEDFFNVKNNTHIMDEEYEHTKTVWQVFGCRTFKDYHKVYLVVDVLLLADMFEEVCRMCHENYSLDPCNFFFFFFFFFYQYQIIKTQKWLHSIVPSKAGIDTRSSGPHFGRHLQFYYLINQQKSRIQGSFVPNNTKKPKKLYEIQFGLYIARLNTLFGTKLPDTTNNGRGRGRCCLLA